MKARFQTDAFAVALAACIGNTTISLYLVVERAVAQQIAPLQCLLQLYQWDASNVFGNGAFAGGWGMAFMGLLMDLAVSAAWATLFLVLYRRFAWLRANLWAGGLAYGIVVMVVMLWLIVPLGHATQLSKTPGHILNVAIAHTVFFGLPVALALAERGPRRAG